MSGLYGNVVGQEQAVTALRAAAAAPVHAYLLVGPPGTGKAAAAASFAASLLCPGGGDGTCDTCRRVMAGVHPDVVVIAREGPAISMDTAREVTRLATRSPVEGSRKVLLLEDFHLVRDAGPALLKTIEEPPASTVFVILAEHVPPELTTIASRCARVDFAPLGAAHVAEALRLEGVPGSVADAVAAASAGRLDRARLLAADPGFEERLALWQSLPARLDGYGATAVALAGELVASLESSLSPLRLRQQAEVAALQERNAQAAEVNGKPRRGPRGSLASGVKEMEARHQRELRRQRTDELRAGLAALASAYCERLPAGGSGAAAALSAIALVDELAKGLAHNPNEGIALLGLLARLGTLPGGNPAPVPDRG